MMLARNLLCLLAFAGPVSGQVQTPPPQAPVPPASAGSPAVSQATVAHPGDFRIGPEDVLAIVVLDHPDYTRTVPVRPDGKVSLPVVNDVMAAGLTPEELRLVLMKGLERYIKAEVLEVSVIVTEVNSVKVSVLGNVRTPIRFVLRSRATVLDALAMAGGFSDFAKRDRVQIMRVDGSTITVDFDKFFDRAAPSVNHMLRPGDIIIVG
jgi:polysaccharide export outer membrane protein